MKKRQALRCWQAASVCAAGDRPWCYDPGQRRFASVTLVVRSGHLQALLCSATTLMRRRLCVDRWQPVPALARCVDFEPKAKANATRQKAARLIEQAAAFSLFPHSLRRVQTAPWQTRCSGELAQSPAWRSGLIAPRLSRARIKRFNRPTLTRLAHYAAPDASLQPPLPGGEGAGGRGESKGMKPKRNDKKPTASIH